MVNDLDPPGLQNLGIGAKATLFPNSRFSLFGIKIVGALEPDPHGRAAQPISTPPRGGDQLTGGGPQDHGREIRQRASRADPLQRRHTVDDALDAIEASPPATGLNRIEHSTMARADAQADEGAGRAAHVLMNHVFFYGAAYRDQIFGRADGVRTAVPASPKGCLHPPYRAPCSPPGALRRPDRDDASATSKVGDRPDQAISVEAALRAVTSPPPSRWPGRPSRSLEAGRRTS
jgi:hypothetical protein